MKNAILDDVKYSTCITEILSSREFLSLATNVQETIRIKDKPVMYLVGCEVTSSEDAIKRTFLEAIS